MKNLQLKPQRFTGLYKNIGQGKLVSIYIYQWVKKMKEMQMTCNYRPLIILNRHTSEQSGHNLKMKQEQYRTILILKLQLKLRSWIKGQLP